MADAVVVMDMRTVICIKWGDRYPAAYVNRLYRGVMRNVAQPTRFVAFTDDGAGLDSGVEVRAIPAIRFPEAELRPGPWRKLAVWSSEIGLEGDLLFLDLDVVVTGALDELFEYEPGKLCMLRNWTQSDGTGNTSVFRFRAGSEPQLVSDFESDPVRKSFYYDNEQIYVTREAKTPIAYWPPQWCPSFKFDLLPRWPMNWFRQAPLPADAKIVVFTGHPRPEEALRGEWPARPLKRIYKHLIAPDWLGQNWR
jgi:hypothetical protein